MSEARNRRRPREIDPWPSLVEDGEDCELVESPVVADPPVGTVAHITVGGRGAMASLIAKKLATEGGDGA